MTSIGRSAVEAYAVGQSVDDFLAGQPFRLLTPEIAGAAMVELVEADAADIAPAYVLNGAGLQNLPYPPQTKPRQEGETDD